MLPFSEKCLTNNTYERSFSKDLTEDELVWHFDEEDRTIELVSGEGWFLQKDIGEPLYLDKNSCHYIVAGEFHRLVKSPDAEDLLIKVYKHK